MITDNARESIPYPPARTSIAARTLAIVVVVSAASTLLPIPYLREWGIVAVLVIMLAKNRYAAFPRRLSERLLLALAMLSLLHCAIAIVWLGPFWLSYQEIPCAIEVLAVLLLCPLVHEDDFYCELIRLSGWMLWGGLLASVLALCLYFGFERLSPLMDQVFNISGSLQTTTMQASLRSDYNLFAIGALILVGVGASLAPRRKDVVACVAIVSVFLMVLTSDSRRSLLFIPLALTFVVMKRWGCRGVVLFAAIVAGSVLLFNYSSADSKNMWFSARSLHAIEIMQSRSTEIQEGLLRNGIWQWSTERIERATIAELIGGVGLGYMIELGVDFNDRHDMANELSYSHNFALGTLLTSGVFGGLLLAAVLIGVLRHLWMLSVSRSMMAFVLVGGLLLGLWSGNTVFSIPILALILAVILKLRSHKDWRCEVGYLSTTRAAGQADHLWRNPSSRAPDVRSRSRYATKRPADL